jgi:hypothetical protein
MNWLAVILALLIAALPVQAGACPMDDPATSPDAALAADTAGGHDCCPGDGSIDATPDVPCVGEAHCSQCVVPGSVLPAQASPVAIERPQVRFAALNDSVSPSHHQPPYRPPIS